MLALGVNEYHKSHTSQQISHMTRYTQDTDSTLGVEIA